MDVAASLHLKAWAAELSAKCKLVPGGRNDPKVHTISGHQALPRGQCDRVVNAASLTEDKMASGLEVEARAEANFCNDFISRNRNMARPCRGNGRLEFSG